MRQRNSYRHDRPKSDNAQTEMKRAASRMEGGQDNPDIKHGSFGSIRSKLNGLGLPNWAIRKIMGKADEGHDIRMRIDSNIEIIVFAYGAETAASMLCEKTGLVFMKPQLLARALDFPVGKALAIAEGCLRSGFDYQKQPPKQEKEEHARSEPARPIASAPAQEDRKLESIMEWKARKKEEETRAKLSGLNTGPELLDKVIGSLKQLRMYDALTVHRNIDALLSSGAGREEISGLIDDNPGILMSSKIKIKEECRRLSIIRTVPYLEGKLQALFRIQAKQDLVQKASEFCIDEKGADQLLSILCDLKVFAEEYFMKPEDFKRFIRENLVRLAEEDQLQCLDMLMDEIKKLKSKEASREKPERNGKKDAKEVLNAHIENAMRFILSVGFRLQTAKAAVENTYFRIEYVHNNIHYRKPEWSRGMNEVLYEKILDVAWARLVRAGAIKFHKLGGCAGVRMPSKIKDERVALIVKEELHKERNGQRNGD